MTKRTQCIQRHFSSLTTEHPQQPFQSRTNSSTEKGLGNVGLSLITHLQLFDLNDQQQHQQQNSDSKVHCPFSLADEFEQVLGLPFIVPSMPLGTAVTSSPPTAAFTITTSLSTHVTDFKQSPASIVGTATSGPSGLPLIAAPSLWLGAVDNPPSWINTSLFVPFTRVLYHILLQTSDSMFCPQFELRRIGTMVYIYNVLA